MMGDSSGNSRGPVTRSQARKDSTENAFQILCFGDSLTEGWTEYGTIIHPYSISLQQTLLSAIPQFQTQQIRLEVYTDGQAGDKLYKGKFLVRMHKCIEKHVNLLGPDFKYDWAIVLGGINDLAWPTRSVRDVYEAFEEFIEILKPRAKNILVLSLMEVGENYQHMHAKRVDLNKLYAEYVTKSNSAQVSDDSTRMWFYDLGENFPLLSLKKKERDLLWSDSVHPTKKGYDVMGELIANALIGMING
ncbi:hypothetical protein HK098_008125 [Nowakowskiella sp. JEL0407]|nr:hypothetical protein HK098_008125 [Nowakowskiella sp. JEL0407]